MFCQKSYFGGHIKSLRQKQLFSFLHSFISFRMEKMACWNNNGSYQRQAVIFNEHNLDHAIFIFLEQNCAVKTMQYLKEK